MQRQIVKDSEGEITGKETKENRERQRQKEKPFEMQAFY
jgi:hypothetical protein